MKVFIFSLPLLSFSQAAVIENYSSQTNDRFANSTQFVGAGHDFSGVGRTSNGRWATLIAPNIFVSATHFRPGLDQEVSFFAGNDATAQSFSYQVAGVSRIQGSDLLIGHFDEAVDSSLSFYNWQSEELDRSAFAGSGLFNADIFQLSRSDEFGNLTDLAVGQNTVSAFFSNLSIAGLGAGDFLTTRYSLTDDHTQYHEALLDNGDSGSPLLLVDGNELTVVGVASARTSTTSFFTYTGTSVDEVQSYIQLNGIPVPEPSASFLLGLSLTGLWLRRR